MYCQFGPAPAFYFIPVCENNSFSINNNLAGLGRDQSPKVYLGKENDRCPAPPHHGHSPVSFQSPIFTL